MKVLIINSVCGTGSTGNIVAGIHNMLRKNGHECRIVYGIGKSSKVPDNQVFKMNNKLGYYIHNIFSRIIDGAGCFSYFQTRRAINYIKKFNPDIINLHNLHGYYINLPLLFKFLKKQDIPVVWTLHDCWTFTGHCAHFDYIKCEKWKSECKKCPQKNTYPKSYIDRASRNYKIKKKMYSGVNNLTIVTPSEWLAKLVQESMFSGRNVYVLNNGINLDIFKPTKSDFRKIYNISDETKILLGVSNVWYKKKGFDDFLKLSEMLSSEYKLVIVGLSEEQLANLPENIIRIKRTSDAKELAGLYSEAYAFINMTYEDTFPTVNIEAIACGTPVITYKTCGSPEAAGTECGAVTLERTPEAVINELDNIANISQGVCVERAKKFNSEEQYKKYIDLFDSIIRN